MTSTTRTNAEHIEDKMSNGNIQCVAQVPRAVSQTNNDSEEPLQDPIEYDTTMSSIVITSNQHDQCNTSTPLLPDSRSTNYGLTEDEESASAYDQAQNDQATRGSATMTLILFATIVVAIQSLPLFTSCLQGQLVNHIYDLVRGLRDIFLWLCGILSLVFVLKFKNWRRKGWINIRHHAGESNILAEENQFCKEFLKIPELLVFAIFTLCYVVNDFVRYILIIGDNDKLRIVKTCIVYATYVCATILILLFIVRYQNVILKQCNVFNYALIAFVGFAIYFWLMYTFRSGFALFSHRCNNNGEISHKNSTVMMEILGNTRSFLEPFVIEFFTISIGILIKLWNTMFERLEITEPNDREENNNTNTATTVLVTSINKKVRNWMSIILSLFVAISYVVSYIILSDHFEFYQKTTLFGEVYLWEGIKFTLYLPQCVLILCSWKSILANRPRVQTYTTKDYFLFGLSIAVYFYGTLRIICALALLIYSDDLPDLEDRPSFGVTVTVFLFATFGIFQVYVQSHYLMIMQNHHINLGNIHRGILVYTGSLNIAEWFILSLGHVWSAESKDNLFPLFTYVFGTFTTELIKVLFFPLIIFYNFHCAILVYEILKDM